MKYNLFSRDKRVDKVVLMSTSKTSPTVIENSSFFVGSSSSIFVARRSCVTYCTPLKVHDDQRRRLNHSAGPHAWSSVHCPLFCTDTAHDLSDASLLLLAVSLFFFFFLHLLSRAHTPPSNYPALRQPSDIICASSRCSLECPYWTGHQSFCR